MAIEKGIYVAPSGIEEEVEGEEGDQELEIEIVDPEMVTLDDGSVEITIVPGEMKGENGFGDNLAEDMDEEELQELSGDLLGLVAADVQSRKEWAAAYVKGLDVLGFKTEERTSPWEGACGVYSTVLSEAAIRFQASISSAFSGSTCFKESRTKTLTLQVLKS